MAHPVRLPGEWRIPSGHGTDHPLNGGSERMVGAVPTRSERDASRERQGAGGGEGRGAGVGCAAAPGRATGRASSGGVGRVLAGSHHVGRTRSKGGWMTSTQAGDGVLSPELETIADAAHDRLRADAGEDLAAAEDARRSSSVRGRGWARSAARARQGGPRAQAAPGGAQGRSAIRRVHPCSDPALLP